MTKASRPAEAAPGAHHDANAGTEQGGDTGERRVAPRLPAALVPAIAGVRLESVEGAVEGRLVNISTSGVLVECGTRVRVGGEVTIRFAGTFSPAAAPARAVRTAVSQIGQDGTLRYQVGLAFLSAIALPDPGTSEGPGKVSRPATPAARVGGAPRNRW